VGKLNAADLGERYPLGISWMNESAMWPVLEEREQISASAVSI